MLQALDYAPLIAELERRELAAWAAQLPDQIAKGMDIRRYGDIPKWHTALDALPDLLANKIELNAATVSVGADAALDTDAAQQLHTALHAFHPWRKGPFELFGEFIDTEWRSDWKWDRIKDAVGDLHGQAVLDVGCGSGYHCWRMAGAGAELVVGIDPTPLFVYQYWVLQRYIQNPAVWVLPLRCENLPQKLQGFDTAFSLGVLYHRRSPMEHLLELQAAVKPGGQLILETLVVDGGENTVLVPEGRYAKMGNVWFLPSVKMLENWLRKLKFEAVEVVDINTTTVAEQRTTEWMRFHSLAEFLDPADASKTIEGYPAPQRAVIKARTRE